MTTIKLKGVLGVALKDNKLTVTIVNEYVVQIESQLIALSGKEVTVEIYDNQTEIGDFKK